MLIPINKILVPETTKPQPRTTHEIYEQVKEGKEQTIVVQKIGGKYVLVYGFKELVVSYRLDKKEINAKLIPSGLLTVEELIEKERKENENAG